MRIVVVCLCGAALLACPPVNAEPMRFDSIQRSQREYSVLLGYGENHKIPDTTTTRFGLEQVKIRIGRFRSSHSQVGYELTAARQTKDLDGMLYTATVGYRRYFMQRGRTALGLDFGVGLAWFTKHVPGHATRGNFTEQVGLVLQHAVGPSSAVTAEYRFRHISNAGIEKPNRGVNTSVVSLGYSWYK